MRLTLLLLAGLGVMSGCKVDNELNGNKDGDPFDSGDSPPVEDTDVQEDTNPLDTEDTAPLTCPDDFLAGYEIPVRDDCVGGQGTPIWSLDPVWEARMRFGLNIAIAVGQLNDDNGDGLVNEDDMPDVAAVDDGTYLHAISGADGTDLWSEMIVDTGGSTPAIADLDGDGFPELIYDSKGGITARRGSDGQELWTAGGVLYKNKGQCGALGVADFDGDGNPEVFQGANIIDGLTGSEIGDGAYGSGTGPSSYYGISVVADLDQDGSAELITGNAAYDMTGAAIWYNGAEDGHPAIADLDGDGSPEIILTGSFGVRVMDRDGNELWSEALGWNGVGVPVIADVDGDGEPNIVVSNNAHLLALDADGNELWAIDESAGTTGAGSLSAYDLDGGGTWEVLWTSEAGLHIVDGVTGTTLVLDPGVKSGSCPGFVPVVDMDGDGHAEVIAQGASGIIRALRDEGGFSAAGRVWHQHDYWINNIFDDSSVPAHPDPNWEDANNFRAGPPITLGRNLQVSVRQVCDTECESDKVVVWVSVGNDGIIPISDDFTVEITGVADGKEKLLGTIEWTADLPSGTMSDAERVVLEGVPRPLYDLGARIVYPTETSPTECLDVDNADVWGGVICLE